MTDWRNRHARNAVRKKRLHKHRVTRNKKWRKSGYQIRRNKNFVDYSLDNRNSAPYVGEE